MALPSKLIEQSLCGPLNQFLWEKLALVRLNHKSTMMMLYFLFQARPIQPMLRLQLSMQLPSLHSSSRASIGTIFQISCKARPEAFSRARTRQKIITRSEANLQGEVATLHQVQTCGEARLGSETVEAQVYIKGQACQNFKFKLI